MEPSVNDVTRYIFIFCKTVKTKYPGKDFFSSHYLINSHRGFKTLNTFDQTKHFFTSL